MVIGRIYKIISGQGNECYVGSTLNKLNYRFQGHKDGYKTWKNKNGNLITSFLLFEKYGIENCKIILIKEYNVVDKKQLKVYEVLWIRKLKPNSMNKLYPFHIPKLYSKIQNQKYYLKTKEDHKITKICVCGSVVGQKRFLKHLKTKKHQSWIDNENNQNL